MNKTDTRYIIRMWSICVLMPCLALIAIGIIASAAEGITTQPTQRVCFPASHWAPAPDSVRPCVTLKANAPEAGALRFSVSDASGVVRYSGYINTAFKRLATVHVDRVEEDGSFTWTATNLNGAQTEASVGNLED